MQWNTPRPVRLPASNQLFKVRDGKRYFSVSYSQIETFQQCPYKWYKTYVEGMRSTEKQEALSYGTVVHQTMEFFFKNGKRPTAKEVGDAYNYFAAKEDIPFESLESGLESTRDAGLFIGYVAGLMERDASGGFKKPDSDLTPTEKLLRHAYPIGVEESFNLSYRLPKEVSIEGEGIISNVWINGSIDLHLGLKSKGKIHHYVVDWKSGRKMFDKAKLAHNLQHPIYAFHVTRRYGDGLPDMGIYFFTRFREPQLVKVDEARVRDAVSILNKCFLDMYDFHDKSVTKFYAYVRREDGEAGKHGYRTAYLSRPVAKNMEPKPSPLCHWCDFGKQGKGLCPYSSDWSPEDKKNL